MIKAGLRRLALLVGALSALAVVPSALVAAITGTGLARSVSLGFMFVGAFAFVAGAAVGLRGPARPTRRPDGTWEGVRLASPDERVETLNVSHVLVVIGLALVVIGLALAPGVRIV